MTHHQDLCDCRVIHRDLVERARNMALAPGVLDDLSRIFKALADPSRLKIIRALEQQEMCVCDLAALLGISESAVSHQLRLLRTMRLVRNRRAGTILYYRLDDNHVAGLIRLALEHVNEK
ncbi:MAG: metalloregulator ArsR/SmtB family transcription factor [Desulfobacterales bacterium]|nr:metalloregulator ArsR/SmtB family transcription factor [Desulfobacterales bacterium]